MKNKYTSPPISCIICREVKSAKGIFSHYFNKHDPIGVITMSAIRAKGTAVSFSNKLFQKKIHKPKVTRILSPCANSTCCNLTKTKFCSRSCAAITNNLLRTKESRTKQVDTLLKNKLKSGWIPKTKTEGKPKIRVCTICGRVDKTTRHFQSDKCIYCNDSLTYRNLCKFTFNLKDYPNEFDLTLLTSLGMFHPLHNQIGVSRDHLVSIHYGKQNKIDPKILSHPANCQLITQSQNSTKNHSSSITIEELLLKIVTWNEKYKK